MARKRKVNKTRRAKQSQIVVRDTEIQFFLYNFSDGFKMKVYADGEEVPAPEREDIPEEWRSRSAVVTQIIENETLRLFPYPQEERHGVYVISPSGLLSFRIRAEWLVNQEPYALGFRDEDTLDTEKADGIAMVVTHTEHQRKITEHVGADEASIGEALEQTMVWKFKHFVYMVKCLTDMFLNVPICGENRRVNLMHSSASEADLWKRILTLAPEGINWG